MTRIAACLLLALLAAPARAQDDGLPLPKPRVTTSVAPSTVTTGFDPKKDGLPFPNTGDYASPNGNCIGTSIVAIDDFLARQAREKAGEPDPAPRPIVKNPQDVSFIEEATTSLAQERAEKEDDTDDRHETLNKGAPLRDPKPILAALERIEKSGTPEILTFDGKGDGHATVLFGYANGKLQVYDPNYPGETVEWPFDPKKGLGKNPKAKDDPFYAHIENIGSTPFSQLHTSQELAQIRKSVAELSPEVAKRYVQVGVTKVVTDSKKTRISGKISGGLKKTFEGDTPPKPTVVWASVNGKAIGRAKIARDGTFSVDVPATALAGSNDVHLTAITGDGLLAGFLDRHVQSKTPGIVNAIDKQP